ncbi:GSCFA domain-containing protein [Flavobacterium sediminilitoris]|uniref:GSCFA domain-containing protein n=1 Tax=Flavobacterium sediminilitoris TaxID=2024526 RepID=A0ABY4HJZ0_9FLAO|nr:MULTISPECIES: GSCFA domain-containing protein [Flavobacterium]UOX32179.1 GSCFA domain-containing protein [Flavobacterium sediminilitoris]
MQFRTRIPILQNKTQINYQSKIIALGSCFVENIGKKIDYYKFQNTVNPFGIIFNPISLEKVIVRSIQKDYFKEKDIFFHNDLWHCYEVHSELSNPNKDFFLKQLNALIDDTNVQLKQATHCIITLGTSWVYQYNETKEIVANCHKVPQKQFLKQLLSIDEIEKSLKNIVFLVASVNPNCSFIFTVSPVRHIKDGFVENNVSKAHLISAIHNLLNTEHLKRNTNYFPSYEIVMDELRDYRFYAEDMLHPNQVAIDYIWQRFKETVVSEIAFLTMDEVETIQKALSHRPFNPNSSSHLKFIENTQRKISNLQAKFSFIQF